MAMQIWASQMRREGVIEQRVIKIQDWTGGLEERSVGHGTRNQRLGMARWSTRSAGPLSVDWVTATLIDECVSLGEFIRRAARCCS